MITVLTFLGFLIEAAVQMLQPWLDKLSWLKDKNWKPGVAFLLGALFTPAFGIDMFAEFGFTLAVTGVYLQILNALVVGLLLARYSGKINDLLEWVQTFKAAKK